MTSTGYLNAEDAATLDEELMTTPGFTLDQLMELAGLAVAEAVHHVLEHQEQRQKVLLICGPGNNGGDGLVAARHLVLFGYDCIIVYPKRSSREPHYANLVKQCEDFQIPILDAMPPQDELSSYAAIVDAIFGFSFQGEPREPFASILTAMQTAQEEHDIPVLSVDVPSGWNVDEGDIANTGFVPHTLISLTTPKECSRKFEGRHFVGGRFLPPALADKYRVRMPPYPGVSQVMEVTGMDLTYDPKQDTNTAGPEAAKGTFTNTKDVAAANSDWEAECASYLNEKHASENPPTSVPKPKIVRTDQNADDDASWEMQYAAYCAEKEARVNNAEEVARRTSEETSWQEEYAAYCSEKEKDLNVVTENS